MSVSIEKLVEPAVPAVVAIQVIVWLEILQTKKSKPERNATFLFFTSNPAKQKTRYALII